MSPRKRLGKNLAWESTVEKFEEAVVALLAVFLVLIIGITTAVAIYIFASNLGAVLSSISDLPDLQRSATRAFSGVLLVLLGLELLDTVKVYFREHVVRVEVILLVGMIAMGRHVLEINLHHIDPLILYGFSILLLALAGSYFLVKRAQLFASESRGRERLEGEHPTEERD